MIILHWFQELDWQEWVFLGIVTIAAIVVVLQIIFDPYDGTYC